MNHLIYMGSQDNTTYACHVHHHPNWEITYYMEGEGINVTAGVEYPFSAGTIICQPPHIEHHDISPGGYKNIFFEVEHFHWTLSEPIVVYDTAAGDLLTIIRQMYQEYFTDNDERVTDALLHVLHVYLDRRVHHPDNHPFVERLKREIIFNYADPNYQILDAIREIPISESQFRRIFRREVGMTPQVFLQSTRLEHAKRLLVNETLPISQIAHMCGYTDSYYFSRAFKKVCQCSPRDWRSRHIHE